MGLIEALAEGPVGLDSVVFIDFIEEHPKYLQVVAPLFAAIDSGSLGGVTSSLTLLEVLVQPYRAGDSALADAYERILGHSRHLELVPIDGPLLRAAALLRSRTRIRTPDALQLSAAFARGCGTFVTNDRDLPAVPGIRILRIDDHL